VQVFASDFALQNIKTFSLSLLTCSLFEKDVLPGLLTYLCRKFDSASEQDKSAMTAFLADIVLQKVVIPEDGSQLHSLQIYPLDFGRAQKG
jgi:hypothetical protein